MISEKLFEQEPLVVLGNARRPEIISDPVLPSALSCFGPRGAIIIGDWLYICDTGHHRLLGFEHDGLTDQGLASLVIGQPCFEREGRNGKSNIAANTLNVPTGLCAVKTKAGLGLAVADAWNHRVLIWHSLPEKSGVPADLVLGQKDFEPGEANQGAAPGASPDASCMHWPYGVYFGEGKLFVADSGNRRVLVWNSLPTANNQKADLVLGQRVFDCRDENAGHDPDNMSMRWPHGITIAGGKLCVSDAGNNRVMIWSQIPEVNGAPCDVVLGQKDFRGCDHNQGRYNPDASALNMPYSVASYQNWLLVTDTANSRIVGYDLSKLTTGMKAELLLGQKTFGDKGDNRWKPPQADSFCWPYHISVDGELAVISDSGNNRVSVWRLRS